MTAVRVTLVKDGDRWKITAPQALPADQVEAGALLTRLRELKAQGFLSDDASLLPRFLAKPSVKVTVTEQGGAALTEDGQFVLERYRAMQEATRKAIGSDVAAVAKKLDISSRK